MLAQQALEAIAGRLPRQQAFQKFVDTLRKEQEDSMEEAPVVQAGHTLTSLLHMTPHCRRVFSMHFRCVQRQSSLLHVMPSQLRPMRKWHSHTCMKGACWGDC